jgi:hypothetical protein
LKITLVLHVESFELAQLARVRLFMEVQNARPPPYE